jgi:phage baseplate assembly protein W
MSLGVQPIIDIDRDTGELIQGWPRCKKSITTILTTRLRTRIMRLWWGSEFLNAQDKPNNNQTYAMSIQAALNAIDEYEPEFIVGRVLLGGAGYDGTAEVTIEGEYTPDKTSRSITVTV